MKIDEIYQPISKELNLVKLELTEFQKDLDYKPIGHIFNHVFKNTGKLLRPALVLLSARTVNPKSLDKSNHELIQLAYAMELIHTSSLIHDDIIDEHEIRRGQKTLNSAFGNRIAVLAGDTLYSEAFSIYSRLFSKDFCHIIGQVTKKMSIAELMQVVKTDVQTSEDYIELIKNKTAILMSACCQLGASLAGASHQQESSLKKYGMLFGMIYQLVDDYTDNDSICIQKSGVDEAQKLALDAIKLTNDFEDTPFKTSLIELMKYCLNNPT